MSKLTICNSALMRCGSEPITSGELATPTTKRAIAVTNQIENTLKELLMDSPWNFATKKIKISIQSKAITSWSNSGTTVTLVVASGHGFVADDIIKVAGLLTTGVYPPNIDGVKVNSVTATTIVYTFTDTPTGTPTVTAATAYVTASDLFRYQYRYALPSDCIRVLELEDKEEYRVQSTGIVCNTDTYIQVKYIYYTDSTAYYTSMSGSFIKAFILKLAEDMAYVLVQSAALQDAITKEAERYLRKARSMNSQEGVPETRFPEEYTAGIRR